MAKKKKRKFKEAELTFEKEEEKKPEISVHVREEDKYAVLEPLNVSEQEKPKTTEKFLQMKKMMKEEKSKPEVKPSIIPKRVEQEEIEPKVHTEKFSPKPSEEITKPLEEISKIPLNQIETDIDKMMRIIDEKKVVGLDYLSKTLKINVERLEAWAKMLEDRGLIEIEYSIIGLPKLRKKEWKKES